MSVRVKLPPDSLINCYDFSMAIAQAICPAGEDGLEGIDCIVGKSVRCCVSLPPSATSNSSAFFQAGMQAVLTSDDGRPLENLLTDHEASGENEAQLLLHEPVPWPLGELHLPFKLTDEDRRALEEVLPLLPPLRYPISDDEANAFISAYVNVKGRPEWIPRFVTAETIEDRKAEQAQVMTDHQIALQGEVANGRMVAIARNHVRVAALSIGCYFQREEAIAYLDRNGIPYRNCEMGVVGPCAESQQEDPPEPSSTGKMSVGTQKLSPGQREQAVAHYKQLMKSGADDPTKQTAEMFGITDRYVRKLVEKSKPQSALDQFVAASKGRK